MIVAVTVVVEGERMGTFVTTKYGEIHLFGCLFFFLLHRLTFVIKESFQ